MHKYHIISYSHVQLAVVCFSFLLLVEKRMGITCWNRNPAKQNLPFELLFIFNILHQGLHSHWGRLQESGTMRQKTCSSAAGKFFRTVPTQSVPQSLRQ